MAEIKRPNYFTSQFLVDQDFIAEQSYHLSSRRRHNRGSHTFGVAEGLDVTPASGTEVTIGTGTAIDKDGREIVLLSPVTYTLETNNVTNADVFLTIAYRELFDQADHYPIQDIDNFTRATERPLLHDAATAPPNDGSVILLARIHLDSQANISGIDTGVRTLVSGRLAPGAVTTTQLADGSVTNAKLANYAVGAANLDGFARGQHGVFLETFEELPSDWTAVAGTGVETVELHGETGGRVLQVQGYRWRVFPKNIPFDPSKLYRIRARVRPIAHATNGKEQVFVGVEGVAADGVTLVNISGSNETGNQHYVCISALNMGSSPLNTWIERTSWFGGHATSGSLGTFADPTAPGRLHANVRYFRPLFILGHDGGDGIAEIDSIAIDVFDESAVVRTYSALNADGTVKANRVVESSIVNGAVTTPKLAPGAVDSPQLHDGSVIETKLADGAVTLNKLGPNSVDGTKLAAGSVGTTHIVNGAVHQPNLADGSVSLRVLALTTPITGSRTVNSNNGFIDVFIDSFDDAVRAHKLTFYSVIIVSTSPGGLLQTVNLQEIQSRSGTTHTRILRITNPGSESVTVEWKIYRMATT